MSLFVFNNQQKLMKSIPNRDLISVVQDQAINVSDTLFVEMPADIWNNLKEPATYLAVQDPYERFSYHMYKVSKHTTKADTTDIEAIQIGYDELKAYGYIKDRRFNNRPVLEAATAVVSGTDWQLGYVDTDLPNVNTNFYYISRLEALSKLIEATGAEVRFRVEISGNKIIAKRMDLYKKLGTFKGKRFAYGSNLLEIVKEEDTSELYTALVGRGKGEETDTGGFGRRITFADIAWSKANGKPLDKPLGQEFIELPEMTAYYGYPDGEPRTGIVEFGEIEEPEQLLNATYERLVEISRPQIQFKAKVQTVGDMQLGEEVAIIRSDLGFRYKTRVFRVKRDYLNNMFTEVELGDKLTESLASRIKKIDTTNAQREETIIQYIQTAANGKNKIFRGPVEPTEGMMVNDLWYKPVGDGDVELYIFDGVYWQLVPFSSKAEVDAAQATADQAKREAQESYENAVQEAGRLVTEQKTAFDVKFENEKTTLQSEINTGIDTAILNAKNYTDQKGQAFDNRITENKQEIGKVKSNADKAVDDANRAIADAGFAKGLGEQAVQQAESAAANANQAKTDASSAITKAGQALEAFNSMEIGNRNFLRNSSNVWQDYDFTDWTFGSQTYTLEELGLEPADRLYLSGEYEAVSGTSVNLQIAFFDQKGSIAGYRGTPLVSVGTQRLSSNVVDIPAGSVSMQIVHIQSTDGTTRSTGRYRLTGVYKSSVPVDWTQNLDDVQVQITNINGELSRKVSQTTFDTLKGTVSSQGTDIAQNKREIVLKANIETINTLAGRVSTAEGAINTQAGQIALKANQTTVDSLSGRVDKTESTLVTQAGSITVLNTKTDGHATQIGSLRSSFDGMSSTIADVRKDLNGKASVAALSSLEQTVNGLQSTVADKANQSQVTQLAGQLTSVVNGFSNLEIGGRNYVKNSNFANARENWTVNGSGSIALNTTHSQENHGRPGLHMYGTSTGNFEGIAQYWDMDGLEKGDGFQLSFDVAKDGLDDNGLGIIVHQIGANNNILVDDRLIVPDSQIGDKYRRINFSLKIKADGVIRIKIIFRVPGTGLVFNCYITDVQFERGTHPSDWKASPEDFASQSQFTQLSDQMNLRVKKADLLSQINIEADNILIQTNKLYLDVKSVHMTTAYVNDLKAKSIEAVHANIADLRTRILVSDVIEGKHLKVDNALIDKLTATTAVVDRFFSKEAVISNLTARTITAVTANIASIRSQILVSNVVESTHLKTDTALVEKIFATSANVGVLTTKQAFVSAIKAIDISADRITTGTLNAANVNIINLNANRIATGTITGANSSWNLNTGLLQTRLPGTTTRAELDGGIVRSYSDRYGTAEINGGRMDFELNATRIGINPLNIYFASGNSIRNLLWTSEGMMTQPAPTNTGTERNSSFHIKGLGTGSVQYLQLISGDGINMRVQGEGNDLTLMHAPGGAVKIAPYGGSDTNGIIQAANFQTRHVNGTSLILVGDRIETPRFNNRNIYLTPNGSGSVVAGNAGGTRYNVVASDFVKQSSRATKTNIVPLREGLSAINALTPVQYNKIDKLNQGIVEVEKGFISEDSLSVATPDGLGVYDSHITAHLVKAVQELDVSVRRNTTYATQHDLEIQKLKKRIAELEERIA